MCQKHLLAAGLVMLLSSCGSPELPENHGKVESKLYLGDGDNQPLIVGIGGSEGGNAWASDRWRKKRNEFIDGGYAFLALGYFGSKNTPGQLDRISIEAVHEAIISAANNPKINHERIAVIGGSKGAELALLMASYYSDIKCVIAIVPCHAVFPALTLSASTSSWTYRGVEVPFVPMPFSAVPAALKKDLRGAYEIMISDKEAVEKALIEVEKINGSILLLSAKKDEMWPSKEMADLVIERLRSADFPFAFQHIAIEGGHTAPLDHFDVVFEFLEKNFQD